jgi:hypothetical protein
VESPFTIIIWFDSSMWVMFKLAKGSMQWFSYWNTMANFITTFLGCIHNVVIFKVLNSNFKYIWLKTNMLT